MKNKKIEKLNIDSYMLPIDPGLISCLEAIEDKINELVEAVNGREDEE